MRRRYSWRHGWIPLTHAAAMAKAHQNARLAEQLWRIHRRRRPPAAHVLEYHAERQAQDRRFENHVGGGISAQDTHTQEYRDYFGVGDHRAGAVVEPRLSWADFLNGRRGEREEDRRRGKAYQHGIRLGHRHHHHKLGTEQENAEFDTWAARHPSFADEFAQGYGDGLTEAYERADRRRRPPSNPLMAAA
jgi:hypothetical protein